GDRAVPCACSIGALCPKYGLCRVIEGTKHARDISERTALRLPFGERTCGLAFEVDEHVVVTGREDLSEMEIPVDAHEGRIFRYAYERFESIFDPLLVPLAKPLR